MRVYVATSWRNERQPKVVIALREAGHEVYDFRSPKEGVAGFHWSDIDPIWQQWTPQQYRAALDHDLAWSGFHRDIDAMEWANAFVGVQPFGRSASLEMGWAAGRDKRTVLLLAPGEPELMVKLCDHICCDMQEVLTALAPTG